VDNIDGEARPYHVALEDSYIRAHWGFIDAVCKLNSIPFDTTGERTERDGTWCVFEFAVQLDAIQFWDRFDGRWLRESDDAEEVKALLEKEGRKAVLVSGDIRDPEHCKAIVKRAVDELGGVDILVNNAAHQATFKDIGDISDEEWRTTFEVNIHAMFYLANAAIPHMKPGSAIVNTASVNSDMPNPILLAYATTKGAIQNFTGGLAQMLAEKGIRVNAVAPGPDLDAAHSFDNA
jgi:NAD(P)-dependent dehydrogenase (short-subunit alcohol dehydrogenase family)